ncbi:MAG TPA: hypothetical protein VHO67_02775 [Polyangia bacterium]|nr:hypothetical protein [Polyangia bacterium]
MRAARAAALSLLVVSLAAGADCYKPNLQSGAFKCSEVGDLCPDTLVCDKRQAVHLCVTSLGGAGGTATGGVPGSGGKGGSATGGAGGMAGAGGTGGKMGTGGSAGAACLPPVASCMTNFNGGACDPVCNVGCDSCDKKCSVNSAGARTCNQLSPKGKTVGILGVCDPSMVGSDPATQSDDCAPGTACVAHNACGPRCYKFCRTSADCPAGASCTIDAGGGASFCDVPNVQCDPVNGASMSALYSGCAVATQFCYLSEQNGQTFCDCYNNGTLGGNGSPCTHSADCIGGLVCTDLNGRGKKCLRVCRLPSPDGGADLTRRDAGEAGCQADYHNCVPILLGNGMQSPVFGACNE